MHVDQPLNLKFKIKAFGALDWFDTSLWIKFFLIFEMQFVSKPSQHIFDTHISIMQLNNE
jgi:hypothetical protein